MKTTKPVLKALLVVAIMVAVMGCANQWREADAGMSSEKVVSLLAEAGTANATSASLIKASDTNGSSLFFAEAPGSLGSVASVISLSSFNFLGKSDNYTFRNINYVRVFFLDKPTGSGRNNSLIIGVRESASGALTYYNFSGPGVFDGDEFTADLKDSQGHELILRTWDVEGDDFKNVIQMRVSDIDRNGNERFIGKFSTMVGFSQ